MQFYASDGRDKPKNTGCFCDINMLTKDPYYSGERKVTDACRDTVLSKLPMSISDRDTARTPWRLADHFSSVFRKKFPKSYGVKPSLISFDFRTRTDSSVYVESRRKARLGLLS